MNIKKTLSLVAVLIGLFATSSQAVIWGGYEYLITDSAKSWWKAQNEAQSKGGNLASIHSAAENEFIRSTFGSYGNLHIGLTDYGSEGTFYWIDGTSVGYTNWNPGEPNNFLNEDYVEMYSGSGKWNDKWSSHPARYGVIKRGVPDSGATLGMLGLGFLCLVAARKRSRK